MTLAPPKTGLLPERAGQLYLADIGIPRAVYHRMKLPYRTPFDHRYRVSIKPKPPDRR
jgi:NAD(P)H-hydrate epimerase